MSFDRIPLLSLVLLLSFATPAHAYIDPGVAYAVVQAAFVVIFGGAVAWVVRPWTYVKNMFRPAAEKIDTEQHADSSVGGEKDGTTK